MKNIIESRYINDYQLRKLCIRHNWYTLGTNADYEHLFRRVSELNSVDNGWTNNDLYTIAADILAHSEPAELYDDPLDVWSIMFELSHIMTRYYAENRDHLSYILDRLC